jgi:hypothetical protein
MMKKFILIWLLLNLVWTKENLVNTLAIIDKNVQHLKAFCSTKNSINFCSPDQMDIAIALLLREKEVLRKNMKIKEREERKLQRIRHKNRIKSEKMIWILREHFLDRHF